MFLFFCNILKKEKKRNLCTNIHTRLRIVVKAHSYVGKRTSGYLSFVSFKIRLSRVQLSHFQEKLMNTFICGQTFSAIYCVVYVA